MARLTAYLNFNGKCKDAMTFYQSCLGGELIMQKISESPMAAQLPSEIGANILHSSLTNESLELMASDMMGSGLVNGNTVTLLLQCGSEEEIELFFGNLSSGGKITTPLHQSFWGARYGELVDKFGMSWMLNYTKS
jgi:PhnB protein